MNCFETRNGFAAFWRKTLEPQAREELLGHLKECAGCDRAFRTFALTGPLLYSDAIPARGTPSHRHASRSVSAMRRGGDNAPPTLRAVCAMLAMVFAAGFAAYLATAAPRQTLDDAISNPEPASELAGQEELPPSLNDFAG